MVAVDFGEAVGKQFLRGCVRWQTEDWEEGELRSATLKESKCEKHSH